MNGTALVGGHGEGRLADHGLQRLLLQRHAALPLHRGKLGVVIGRQAQNIKAGVAAAEMYHQLFIHGQHDHVVRHPADDVAEEPGVQHDAAGLVHVGLDAGTDAGLGVIAGQREPFAAFQQQALQRRNGAFCRNGAAGGGCRVLQQRFFAGEFQHRRSFPVVRFRKNIGIFFGNTT